MNSWSQIRSQASEDVVRRGRAPWSFLEILGVLGLGAAIGLLLVVLGVVIAATMPDDVVDELTAPAQFAAISTAVYGGFGIATWLLIVRRKRLPWSSLGFVSVRSKTLLSMIPAGFILLFINLLLLTPLTFFFGLGDPDAGQGQEEIFSPEGGLQVLDYLWLLIPLAILAPLVEEIGFRGLLYGYMRGRTGVVLSIIVSALVFAVLHIVIPPLFVMGAILAFLAERYRSIVPGIVLHATNNALVVVFIAIANTVE